MKKYNKSNKRKGIKQKIIFYVLSVAIVLNILLLAVMIITSIKLTDYVLLDALQPMVKTASQNVSANLHLLTDRMANIALDSDLADDSIAVEKKIAILDENESRIEFVWLAAYDLEGNQLYGNEAPTSIADKQYYLDIQTTGNLVISEPFYENNIFQLCVGAPLMKDGDTYGYLIGSYKYDIINDVLTTINLGQTGSAYIINKDGTVIADKDTENMKNAMNLYEQNTGSAEKTILDKIITHQTGAAQMKIHGVNHYAAYSPVVGTNWSLIIDAPKAEFLGIAVITIILSVILSIILLVVSAIIIFKLAGRISSSMGLATKRLENLAEGDLKSDIVLSNTNDEVQTLTLALSKTINSLDGYISEIQNSLGAISEGNYAYNIPDCFTGDFVVIKDALETISNALNHTMYQMNTAATNVFKYSSEVSVFVKQLSDGSTMQDEALERLQESIETIVEKIEQISGCSDEAEDCAADAKEKVTLGTQQMNSMLEDMNDIYGNMEEISKISQLIEQIASQINMVSLNASIEAARAGAAGRGFAVVAGEIGDLSAKTASALHQTAKIIDKSNVSINKGVQAAKLTSASLEEIQAAIDQFVEISASLKGIVLQQEDAVQEVAVESAAVYEIAQNNLQIAEQTGLTVSGFLSEAEQLNDLVSQVNLKEDDKL